MVSVLPIPGALFMLPSRLLSPAIVFFPFRNSSLGIRRRVGLLVYVLPLKMLVLISQLRHGYPKRDPCHEQFHPLLDTYATGAPGSMDCHIHRFANYIQLSECSKIRRNRVLAHNAQSYCPSHAHFIGDFASVGCNYRRSASRYCGHQSNTVQSPK
jgi:hypothetical protein